MQRKIATLEVWEDTDIEQSLCAMQMTEAGEPMGRWQIRINPSEKLPNGTPLNKLTTLAHELGHFLAQLVGTKAAKFCAKSGAIANETMGNPLWAQRWFGKAWYELEREAWDFARLIHPGLNEAQAEECLKTYER